ncbi:MAG: endonuclease VII domain-containing protein [Natronosporangium sp.]
MRQPCDVPAGHRYCPDCQVIKPLDDSPRNRSARSGYVRYCKPCHNVKSRENREKHHGSTREYHLRRRYGIGQQEFEQLLAAQGGVCGICGAERPEHVDHDHVTGYVRGVLCFNCNGGLGHFRDDRGRLDKAIAYLTATASQVEVRPGVHLVLRPRRGMHPVRRPARQGTR